MRRILDGVEILAADQKPGAGKARRLTNMITMIMTDADQRDVGGAQPEPRQLRDQRFVQADRGLARDRWMTYQRLGQARVPKHQGRAVADQIAAVAPGARTMALEILDKELSAIEPGD